MALIRQNVKQSAGYVPGEQPSDLGVVKLNTNENPYPPSPRVIDAIRGITPEQLRRYPSPQGKVFREAAARIHGLTPEWILPFNGGDELLSVAIRAAAGENQAVAFFEPSYSLYPVLAELNGSRAVKIPYDIRGTRWSFPDDLDKTLADARPAVLLIVNPNAPSGHWEPAHRLSPIAENFHGLIIIDEAYTDFAPGNALELAQVHPNVILLRTLSKGYALAGLRFGYAIANPDLLKEIEKVRDSYPVDAIAIAAATAAIEDQPYARHTWEKVNAERTRLTSALAAQGFEVPESASNFVLATIPSSTKSRGGRELYEALKARGVLVRWWDLPRIADKIRITIGTGEQNDRLLRELQELI